MKFHPPIVERGKDELIELANFPDKWQPEAVEQAKAELEKRVVSVQEQEKKVKNYLKSIKLSRKAR